MGIEEQGDMFFLWLQQHHGLRVATTGILVDT
jgi:hypothetical protein